MPRRAALRPLLLAHRYMVQKIVGKGARGLVCKGRDVRLDRDIAVKLYPADPALIREVEGEAKALARLRHPNIIGVYDAGQAEFQLGEQSVSCLLLAMEFVEGTNARVWLQRADRHPRAIVALFLAAGDGLAAAHAAATVHRDIKPENIMVDVHGVPRVVDFGLARPAPASPAAPAGPGHTQFGTITGTLEYMAPEARGGLADERSDQFSFAVALWEALTGRLPYDPHRGEWRLADSPDFHGAELLPRRLATPLRRALSHSAGKRHRDLAALLDALRRAEARRTAWLVWGAAATPRRARSDLAVEHRDRRPRARTSFLHDRCHRRPASANPDLRPGPRRRARGLPRLPRHHPRLQPPR
jgi:serine/threonine protein kinase